MTQEYEIIIIGAGIAGASLAYFLANRGVTDVLVLEREEVPGYHATGRSAAVYYQVDPNPTVMKLKLMSGGFLRNPPPGLCDTELVDNSGALFFLQEENWQGFHKVAKAYQRDGVALELLSPREASQWVPVLNPNAFAGAVLLPGCGNLDVHALLSGYLRHAKKKGVNIQYNSEVKEVWTEQGRCCGVRTEQEEFRSPWVVNAAGAWAGLVGKMTAALPINLTPMRRCAVAYAKPREFDVASWPMVKSDDLSLYFKPESSGLLFSPMDEVPQPPCDARPDDVTIASGFERLEQLASEIVPSSIKRKWAGLRTFSDDRVVVVGEDPQLPGFFWLAGQGGCGIETSCTIGAIAADLLVDGTTDRFDMELLGPRRFG